MGQCSCCGATDEVLQHPTEFSMGVAALAAGRFTYADHLFDTAMESHSGCGFWKELRGAAGCQPPEEEKMAEAQLSSTCDARRSLAECWCWRTNPASTTCTRAACGSSSMCVELNVSEAELLPKLDYLRLVADVAMAYTRARYEEQALHYWHPITVCAHELLELIEQRLQRGLLWLKVMMKSEEAPQHPTFPAEGYEWRRRSSASLHVLQGREMRIQQVLVGLQQVLCRYNTCTLMQYGMMLLEEGTHANAILRESADAMSDDEQHEWMKATSCLPTSLPPLTSVARLSAMRHLHMCKIHQVHERSVVMMRQLLLMACKRTGSFFNMQVKGWIGQAIAMMNDENTADADGSLMRGGGSCSTLDSLGGGGGGASTHGGPTRRFHAPEEQTLTLAIKMSDGAAQDNVMTLLVAGEEASLRYAPTEIMGNVLPTMFVGHVASFVANMKMDDVDACAHNTGGLPNDVRPESHHHSIIKTHGSLVGRARAESIGNTTKFVRKILTSTKQSEEDELHAYQDINTALFPCTNSHDSTYFVKSRMLQSGLKDEESLLLMFGLLLLRVKMFLHVDATTPALNSLKQRLECMVKEVYGDEGLMSQLLLDCCHRLPSTSHWLGV